MASRRPRKAPMLWEGETSPAKSSKKIVHKRAQALKSPCKKKKEKRIVDGNQKTQGKGD
jgi:hypothetical protein